MNVSSGLCCFMFITILVFFIFVTMPFVEFPMPIPRFSYGFEANLALFPAMALVLFSFASNITHSNRKSAIDIGLYNLFLWCLFLMLYNTIVTLAAGVTGHLYFSDQVKTGLLFIVNVLFMFLIGYCAYVTTSLRLSTVKIILFLRISFLILFFICLLQLTFSLDIFESVRNIYFKFYRYLEGGWGGADQWGMPYVLMSFRLNGSTQEASTLAILISLFYLPFFLADFIFSSNNKIVSFLYLLLALLILVLSFSSTALLVVALSIFLVFINKKDGGLFLTLLVAMFLCFILFYFLSEDMIDMLVEFNPITKLSSSDDMSTNTRFALIVAALFSLLNNPLNLVLGVGYGNFTAELLKFIPDWALSNQELYGYITNRDLKIHSFIIGKLYSFGLFGMFFFFVYPILILVGNINSIKSSIDKTENKIDLFTYYSARFFFIFFGVLSMSALDDRAFYLWFFVFYHYNNLRNINCD